ncbi:hypothetical protein HELRODRAFT_182466 [Helobdella robusta]|uniref:ISXO2-like transposase domain-containing protein n=1 Tax=Helobdella robusta TaxID=6412 RepID=T1FI87_HELRO|nr:hypothetical protein HELRODRAFT_182466 [Helobdella robusta]ESN90888.1 hypothetical protein HELRODRAFT_182466 [Helobdella robusta]
MAAYMEKPSQIRPVYYDKIFLKYHYDLIFKKNYIYALFNYFRLFRLTYYWSMGDISQATVASLPQIDSSKTLPDWFNFHRELCTEWVREKPVRISGQTKEKRSRKAFSAKVLGGIDEDTKKAFLVAVPQRQRDTVTLMPIVQCHMLPGATVWSYRWATYNSLSRTTGLPHKTPCESQIWVRGFNWNTHIWHKKSLEMCQ